VNGLVGVAILCRRGALLTELFKKGVNVVADVIGPGLRIGHELISGLIRSTLRSRLQDPTEKILRLSSPVFELVGKAAARVRAALGGEHHSEGKPERAPGQSTPDPDVYGAFS
jgi:hypothetical protein